LPGTYVVVIAIAPLLVCALILWRQRQVRLSADATTSDITGQDERYNQVPRKETMRYAALRPTRRGGWAAAALALLAALAAVVVTTGGHASASAGTHGDPATSSLIHRLDSWPSTKQRPTIVLVHGAWADSSSWRGEMDTLRAAGFPVRAVGNPLENLTTDAEFVADFLKTIPGPIVLVGHSYGGAVITNAATGNPNVKALVYVDAAAPAPGETNGQLSGSDSILAKDTPAQLFTTTSIPGAPAGDSELYLNEDIFVHNFANDLPRSEAEQLWASQRGAAQAAFDTPSRTAAWKTIPSWYFISSGDQIITPTSELSMAKRAHSHITVFHGGSHLTLISHPNAVTATITSAVLSLR
jgi:pimeloyl-ACP methyl ester carboxylesterase